MNDRTAGLTLFDVAIFFDDGLFEVGAWGKTKEQAYGLALQDARMACATRRAYLGKVIDWTATPKKKQPSQPQEQEHGTE